MKKIRRKEFASAFVALLGCCSYSASAAEIPLYSGAKGWQETKEERTEWFKDAKFGMFIHWGLYAPAGGYWPPSEAKGKKYPQHYSEWIRFWANVSEPEYGKLTKPLFKPEPGCTDEWAKLAKDAGMKYTVLTTKHHDGYTLFNAKAPYSKRNKITGSTNISPKGRDMVAEYAKSVRAQGLKVGYYYSLIDWQHPDAYSLSRKWALGKNPNHSNYVEYMHSHMKQLFSDYGRSDLIWVDYSSAEFQGEKWGTKKLLTDLHKLQPQALTNNRFWNGLQNPKGDFFTPEKYIPATGFPGRTFEVCHTMNESFGYSHHDTHWKSAKEVVEMLTDIVSKGGNLLLNVGPDARGHIPEESARVLRETGEWLKVNGDAIYGTVASPFKTLPFKGRCTAKIKADKSLLFFHLFEWPSNNKIVLGGLKNEIVGASLLGRSSALSYTVENGVVTIDLPSDAPSDISSVVSLEIKGAAEVDSSLNIPTQAGDRSVSLTPENATFEAPLRVDGAGFGKDYSNIGYWTKVGSTVEFTFNVHTPGEIQAGGTVTHSAGKYALYIDHAVAANAGGELEMSLAGKTLTAKTESTGGWSNYKRAKMGEFVISEAGKTTLTLKAKSLSEGLMNIKSVELIPLK